MLVAVNAWHKTKNSELIRCTTRFSVDVGKKVWPPWPRSEKCKCENAACCIHGEHLRTMKPDFFINHLGGCCHNHNFFQREVTKRRRPLSTVSSITGNNNRDNEQFDKCDNKRDQ